MTPTARTLAWLRKQGYTAAVCEKWIPQTQRRQDLFGFADIVAFGDFHVVLVQATSGSNTAAREHKIRANDAAMRWLKCRKRAIWVVGWRQLVAYKADGSKAKRRRWQPKVTEITNL